MDGEKAFHSKFICFMLHRPRRLGEEFCARFFGIRALIERAHKEFKMLDKVSLIMQSLRAAFMGMEFGKFNREIIDCTCFAVLHFSG